MKAKELKELGVEELKAKRAEQRQELFNLRFQHIPMNCTPTSLPFTSRYIPSK